MYDGRRNLLRPCHAYRSIRHVGTEHLEGEPLQAVGDCPDCENDGCDESPEGRDRHERGTVTPVVGEDGEDYSEDKLDG